MHTILATIWFLLPAGFANMAPIIFNRLPLLQVPVDFGLKYKGKEIFGPHKTWRGLIVGIALAIVVVYIQKSLQFHTASINLVDYAKTNLIWLGFLLGFGALLGDMVKSFFKRRFNIKPGKSWVPFDQVDWVIGAIILAEPVKSLSNKQIAIALIIFGLAHPLANLLGYGLRFKPNKF